MTTLHVLSNPHNPVHTLHRIDPFSWACLKFMKYMKQYGWNIVHYGVKGCDVPVETVICLDKTGQPDSVAKYNERAGQEIAKRKQPGDMIVCFYGLENKGACQANPDLKAVEPSIGYTNDAVWAPYRVFVSYAQMHMYYGKNGMLMNPSWYDAVVYNGITPSEFDYCEDKEDYFLCFGRVIENKGINLAIQATEKMGKKLIIAGEGNLSYMGYDKVPKHVELIGPCNVEQRRQVMKKARAIFGLTYYVEPFGNMVAEAYMSGTPAITADWGGFAETVQQGLTGFRCRDFKDVVTAIERIETIDHKTCYDWAMKNYADDVVHPQFDDYFNKLRVDNFYHS